MNHYPSKQEIEHLRNLYTPGTRVILNYMDDVQAPPPGTEGTVTCVDDIGTIHVNWENGSCLGLVPEVDDFQVLGITAQ